MAQPIPDSFLQEVMDKNDIVDVISRYVRLKRSGNSMKGLCPFHKEKTPSFHVSPDKQLYYCFGCGSGGTVINFMMNIENLDFIETVKYLCEQSGMSLPEQSMEGGGESESKRRMIYKVNKAAARFFYDRLHSPEGEAALSYVKDRGLTEATANRFGLGFSPEGSRLLKHLLGMGFSEEELVVSGMCIRNDNGSVYDRFRNRLMFPIIDLRKNIIGFGGRVMDDSMPKYLNSPETAAFNKSYNLFGLNLAKATKDPFYILVEGYMDVISLHQHGIDSAVATLGTALTPEQARLLKRTRQEVIIAYDSDTAGQNATRRAIELLSEADISVKVLSMGDFKDPDEFVKKNGRGAFREQIHNAKLQIEYKILQLKEKYNLEHIEDKTKYISELAGEFAKIKSPVERELYVSKLSAETGVSSASIFQEIERVGGLLMQKQKRQEEFRGTPSVGRIQSVSPKEANLLRAERLLLNLMVSDPAVADDVLSQLREEDFCDPLNRRLYAMVAQLRRDGAVPDPRLLVSAMGDTASTAQILHDDQSIEDKSLASRELIALMINEGRKRKLLEMIKSSEVSHEQKLDEISKSLRKEVGTDE